MMTNKFLPAVTELDIPGDDDPTSPIDDEPTAISFDRIRWLEPTLVVPQRANAWDRTVVNRRIAPAPFRSRYCAEAYCETAVVWYPTLPAPRPRGFMARLVRAFGDFFRTPTKTGR